MRRLISTLLPALVPGLLLIAACTPPVPTGPKYVVFFQEWSAALDDAAQNAIAQAAKQAQATPAAAVVVTGFADPTGSAQANIFLSQTRAQVVVDQLVQDGVDAHRIRRAAVGATDYTLSAQESRRVEIAVGST